MQGGVRPGTGRGYGLDAPRRRRPQPDSRGAGEAGAPPAPARGSGGFPGGGRFSSWYVYLPVGISRADDRLLAYGTLGWRYARSDRSHALLYGARADAVLAGRVTLIGEVSGAGGDGAPLEYQAGLRLALIPGLVQADLSRGWLARRRGSAAGAGWTVGLALTPRARMGAAGPRPADGDTGRGPPIARGRGHGGTTPSGRSAAGTVNRNTLPPPGRGSWHSVPPCASASRRAMESPSPAPPMSGWAPGAR